MEGLGRSVGDSIGGLFDGIGAAFAAAMAGVGGAFAAIPGGWLWLVGAAFLVVVAWRLVR